MSFYINANCIVQPNVQHIFWYNHILPDGIVQSKPPIPDIRGSGNKKSVQSGAVESRIP